MRRSARLPLIVRALVISLCLSVPGAAALEPAMVLSYGSNNCERFTRAPHQEKQMYLAWTEGFISAANTRGAGASRMVGIFWNRAANESWLQNYCALHPLDGFIAAAEALRAARGARNSG
jgi:hypothetical protein